MTNSSKKLASNATITKDGWVKYNGRIIGSVNKRESGMWESFGYDHGTRAGFGKNRYKAVSGLLSWYFMMTGSDSGRYNAYHDLMKFRVDSETCEICGRHMTDAPSDLAEAMKSDPPIARRYFIENFCICCGGRFTEAEKKQMREDI